jgi:hypothetical protein
MTDSRITAKCVQCLVASALHWIIDCNPSMEKSLLHCCMKRWCFHCYRKANVFIVALLRNCNNFALSIAAATLTLLGQGNLTYATPRRKPNMSQYISYEVHLKNVGKYLRVKTPNQVNNKSMFQYIQRLVTCYKFYIIFFKQK